MTLLFMALAALAAALGTQAASILLIVAATLAATGTTLVAAGTWTAALAAGAMWLSGTRRRLALPIAATSAVLAAGAAPNVAAVLGLWVAGTGATLLAVDAMQSDTGRRFGVMFAAADLPLVAAVGAGAVRGFQGWPSGAQGFVAVALACTAVSKALLARAPTAADEAGVLLVARTQGLIAALLAVRAAPHEILQMLVIGGGVAFAVIPHFSQDAVVDVVQEMALVTIAASSAVLGWGPQGWIWAALAAGTLIHHLRLSTRGTSLASVATLLTRGGAIGFPFLPVVLAELESAARSRPGAGAALVVAFVYGLAARIRPVARARLRRPPRLRELAPLLFVGAAFAASLWAPLLSSPHPPAGIAIEHLPAWAAPVIAAAAAGGWFFPQFVRGPAQPAKPAVVRLPELPFRDLLVRPLVLEGVAAALAAAATLMWALGAVRGFL